MDTRSVDHRYFRLGETALPEPFYYIVVKMEGREPRTWNSYAGHNTWSKEEHAMSALDNWLGFGPLSRARPELPNKNFFDIEWIRVFRVDFLPECEAKREEVYMIDRDKLQLKKAVILIEEKTGDRFIHW